MRRILAGSALACLAACATAPDKIAARPADDIAMISFTCTEISAQRAQVEQALDRAEAAQYRTRRVDAVGLALVLLPVGSLTGGSHARQIADLKGERDALNEISARDGCYAASASAPASGREEPHG